MWSSGRVLPGPIFMVAVVSLKKRLLGLCVCHRLGTDRHQSASILEFRPYCFLLIEEFSSLGLCSLCMFVYVRLRYVVMIVLTLYRPLLWPSATYTTAQFVCDFRAIQPSSCLVDVFHRPYSSYLPLLLTPHLNWRSHLSLSLTSSRDEE
ncbi:hypothetical protein GCK32_005381 [Trichostrongylus colubriformis]|uniref:Uncharacterized protein n=1 Tax=Trichostrongylus colubriformis TaxID=6319 RepID=A0AAN8IKJ5_TRICO